MSVQLQVGNLPAHVTNEDITEILKPYGNVIEVSRFDVLAVGECYAHSVRCEQIIRRRNYTAIVTLNNRSAASAAHNALHLTAPEIFKGGKSREREFACACVFGGSDDYTAITE